MRLLSRVVDVTAGTAFREGDLLPLVRLTVTNEEGRESVVAWLSPNEARAVGLDLIGAGHAAIADAELRAVAKRHGLDGDTLIADLRGRTDLELGPG